jgi:hypothetical protein
MLKNSPCVQNRKPILLDKRRMDNMQLKQFTIGFSRTVNLGNFQSARVEASVTMELDAGAGSELLDSEIEDAQKELRALLEKTWLEQNRKRTTGEAA